ncbi:EAL domain-containing protein [Enterobacter asburiae]|nr:EAL domain-containing protein [Enterobacter asburiae]
MSIINHFANLKVRKKLFFGFSLVLLVTIIILISGLLGLSNIQDKVEKNGHTTDLFNALTQVRLGRTNFQYTLDQKYLDQTNAASQRMQSIVASMEKLSWSPEGKKALDDTANAVNSDVATLLPFTKSLSEKKISEQKLSTQGLCDNSGLASTLSRNGSLDASHALVAAQIAFVMSDIDSQVTLYKQHPTDALMKGIRARLDIAKSDTEQLLSVATEEQKVWLQSGLEDMQNVAAELINYQNVWNQQSTLSDTLTGKAITLTQAIQTLFSLQQKKVSDTVDSVQIQMGIVAAIGLALGVLLAMGITLSITRPLNETLRVAEQIAQGDLTSTLTSTRRDEPGLLMQAVATMNANLKNIINDVRNGVDIEVLARWNHPLYGPVSPDTFIPLAEKHRLIAPLTHHLIQQVIADLQHRIHLFPDRLYINLNLSARNCLDPRFETDTLELLQKLASSQVQLVIEITERDPLHFTPQLSEWFATLRQANISLALDDFGTGCSNISYIHALDPEFIKIDKLFVSQISENGDTRLVDSLIELAKKMHLRIIAEGVETKAQADYLRLKDSDFLQGYYFGKPMKIDELVGKVNAC